MCNVERTKFLSQLMFISILHVSASCLSKGFQFLNVAGPLENVSSSLLWDYVPDCPSPSWAGFPCHRLADECAVAVPQHVPGMSPKVELASVGLSRHLCRLYVIFAKSCNNVTGQKSGFAFLLHEGWLKKSWAKFSSSVDFMVSSSAVLLATWYFP